MCALYEWEKSFVIHLSVDNVPDFSWLSEWEFTWQTRDPCGISTRETLGWTPDRDWAGSNCIFKVSVPQKCFMLKHTRHFQLETHFSHHYQCCQSIQFKIWKSSEVMPFSFTCYAAFTIPFDTSLLTPWQLLDCCVQYEKNRQHCEPS